MFRKSCKWSLAPSVLVLLLVHFTAIGLVSCSAVSTFSNPPPVPSPVPSPVSPDQPASLGSLTVEIYVPKSAPTASTLLRSGSRLHPRYVPSSVNSIVFSATVSAGVSISGIPIVVAIGSAACTPNSGGQTCTTKLIGALGQDQWIVQTFASADGSGTALSRAALVATIVSGQNNLSMLTLSPILSALAFVPAAGSCNATIACTQSLVLNALDASGATIIGPGAFVNAAGNLTPIVITGVPTVTLQTSTSSAAALTLAVAADDNLAKLVYDGTATMGIKTVTAAAGALFASFNLTLAADSIGAPSSVRIGNVDPVTTTIPVTEGGYSSTFTQSNNCAGVATIGAASGNGPSASFPVTQLGGGTCSVLITDNHGGSSSVAVISTTYQVVIQ